MVINMNQENKWIIDNLRNEFKQIQADRLVKIESERALEEKIGVGRQRIREVINQLVEEGLLIKYEGKGTYIAPYIKSQYVNLLCSPTIKSNDPFYNRLLMELTCYSAKNCINIVPLTLENISNGTSEFPLLMIGKLEEEDLKKIKSLFSMVISFENYPEHDDFIQIYFDHFKIGLNAAKVLSSYGHKRVIHITGPDKYASACYRRNGFIRGARKQGMEFTIITEKMNFEGGYRAGEVVAKLVREGKFTAVFAANDWMAIGMIQALKAKGLSVPRDVSVLSVDNIPLASQIAPNLTTYSLDANMMIAEVFSLMDRISDDSGYSVDKRIILRPILITRDTLQKI
ncbi:substrate-binding domain-containing protein [Anaerocolumna sedimenticola]|uniref:Substrate-binding domain-containing protein n=1 Tax=Anaerocolumna sedimenticola TaxID=2696063 RepID=A0A6P1TNM2_9FIRM|nr:substrate-binding domain-containing protein [Anaerocolumna sedimenticola]QHQ62830.1 substrate-binding domain-containing protein [Anaerocolumna sedimenticola]